MRSTWCLILISPIVLGLLALAGCGEDFATLEPKNPDRAADGLRFTRADQSTYGLEDATARCTRVESTGTMLVVLAAHPDGEDDSRAHAARAGRPGRDARAPVEASGQGRRGARREPDGQRPGDRRPVDGVPGACPRDDDHRRGHLRARNPDSLCASTAC